MLDPPFPREMGKMKRLQLTDNPVPVSEDAIKAVSPGLRVSCLV